MINLIITICTFFFMEFVSWFTHKFIMHGILWYLHKDHHQVDKDKTFQKNDYFFFHSWGYAVSRRGDDDHTLPVFVFLRPRKDEKRCDDDNETILWHELFLLDEK